MKRTLRLLASLAAAVWMSPYATADDAAGLLRVAVDPEGETAGEMPFAPFGDATPTNFLSGPFFGGDGDAAPDWLCLFPGSGETNRAAVYSLDGWLDPGTGGPTDMAVAVGDTLLLVPGDSGEDAPFDVFVFGRVPGVASHSGSPRIRRMAVDSFGAFADLDVFTRGLTTDLYAADFETNGTVSSLPVHLGRRPGHPAFFGFRDSSLPPSGGRVYLVADATRDADRDGLPDEMERRIYGTSPYLADTDGDGVSDAFELAWGSDPLLPDAEPPQLLFAESFERPEIVPGPVAGQRDWRACGVSGGAADALVQEDVVFDGFAALEVHGTKAAHSVTCASEVVWVDLQEYPMSWTTSLPEDLDATTLFFFVPGGHPAMSDGQAFRTNALFSVSGLKTWLRCTEKLDFASRTWDLYVDGVLVGENLAMRGDAPCLHEIEISGEACMDGVSISTARPEGLSSDGDALPDEWETLHFGDLSRDGTADADGDGMTDLEEFRAGTDPLVPNGDTDGDGLPDGWEAANGLNPFSPDAPARAALRETFERPGVSPGGLDGQNGWRVSVPDAATVQDAVVHAGAAALEVKGGNREDGTEVLVTHPVRSRAEVLWMDLWQKPSPGFSGMDAATEAFAVIAFDSAGHPVLSDGDAFVTNRTVSVGPESRWVRCSCRYDFPNRSWDFYLDGVLVEAGLAMRGDIGSVHAFDILGGRGWFDDVFFGFARPEGLSSDGDALPDEWEFRTFGSLDRDGSGDFDGDGLADADEFASGTDPTDADTDGDELPDGWESELGLDPLDAADAADDPDGDGLSTLGEYGIGTNPFSRDTDGDGMPDGWEVAHGTDPFAADALDDPDGDGLPNIAEMRHGTDWQLPDTDGDGVSDGDEATLFLSDPASVDFDGTVVTNSTINALCADVAVGTWFKTEAFSFLAGRSGSIAFTNDLILENGGLYQLRVPVAFRGTYDAELVCLIDGEPVGNARLVSSRNLVSHEKSFLSGWLSSGCHEIELRLRNYANDADFSVGDILVCELSGPDEDGNGAPDWIDHRLQNTGNNRGLEIHSLVSPFCLRGVAATPPKITMDSVEWDALRLPNNGWWTNVGLPTNSYVKVMLTFEHGFKISETDIVWEEFDVRTQSDIIVRTGDSLLLSLGGTDGTITMNGIPIAQGQSPRHPYLFKSAGRYEIEGISGDATNSVLVTAVQCDLGEELPAWRGKRNSYSVDGVGMDRMSISWDGGTELVAANISGKTSTFTLFVPPFASPTAMAFEIPNPDASIVSSAKMAPFDIFYTLDGKYYESNHLEDGTRIVENRISAHGVPNAVSFKMTSSSGICFEDGSGKMTFSADDFDESGDLLYRFFVPSGVNHPCQFLHGYFNGKEFAQ